MPTSDQMQKIPEALTNAFSDIFSENKATSDKSESMLADILYEIRLLRGDIKVLQLKADPIFIKIMKELEKK